MSRAWRWAEAYCRAHPGEKVAVVQPEGHFEMVYTLTPARPDPDAIEIQVFVEYSFGKPTSMDGEPTCRHGAPLAWDCVACDETPAEKNPRSFRG